MAAARKGTLFSNNVHKEKLGKYVFKQTTSADFITQIKRMITEKEYSLGLCEHELLQMLLGKQSIKDEMAEQAIENKDGQKLLNQFTDKHLPRTIAQWQQHQESLQRLKVHPQWRIRQSSVPGMLSVDYVQYGKKDFKWHVFSLRFVLLKDRKWQQVTDKAYDYTRKMISITANNVDQHLPALLQLLKDRHLSVEKGHVLPKPVDQFVALAPEPSVLEKESASSLHQ